MAEINPLLVGIKGIGAISPSAPGAGAAEKAAAPGFGDVLKDALGQVNALQQSADIEARKVATGQSADLTEAVVASEKARLAMEFTVQVRNKIVDAYQDLWRMPI